MLQIKNLNLTHKKDLRVILSEFNLVLNKGDKAVIIGEEGNGKSTLMLREFPGAIISISHDRKYIDEVCDKIYELDYSGLRNL